MHLWPQPRRTLAMMINAPRRKRTLPTPAFAGAFEALGHQHLVCSLHLARPNRVAILGDMGVIHATAVVVEITRCPSNFRTASPLSEQCRSIYHSADTLGIVAKSMALGLINLFPGSKDCPAPSARWKPVTHLRVRHKSGFVWRDLANA